LENNWFLYYTLGVEPLQKDWLELNVKVNPWLWKSTGFWIEPFEYSNSKKMASGLNPISVAIAKWLASEVHPFIIRVLSHHIHL
jgi:hypothetical protein